MKFQWAKTILLFTQNLLLIVIFVEFFSCFETLPPSQYSVRKRSRDPMKDPSENVAINTVTADIKNLWYRNSRSSVTVKNTIDETKRYFSRNGKSMKYTPSRVLSKRSDSSHSEQSRNRSHPEVEPLYADRTNNFTSLMLINPFTQTSVTNSTNDSSNFSAFNTYSNVVTENVQQKVLRLSDANENIRWFVINLKNQTRTNTHILNTFNFSIEGNTSDNSSINSQRNVSYFDFCHELFNEDVCMLSTVVIDLRNLYHVLDTNETNLNIPKTTSDDLGNFSDTILYNLTQNFNCLVKEINGLNISCTNVLDLYSIGEYLPNDTVTLDISFSLQVKLLAPLFPHLKSLKSLRLSNNHHRYITRAFMGLEKLEVLDLSNNDIIALIRAFSYVPTLIELDLSGNQLRSVKVPSDAASYLKNLQTLILDHNYHISRIRKDEFYGLKKCKIEVLSLFNTTISNIERGAFNSMSNLRVLEISANYMNEYTLANITCDIASTLEIGYFRRMLEMKSFPYEAVYCLRNTKISKLYLENNYIKTIPVLPSLPYLRLFSVSNCSVASVEIDAFENVTQLEVINLRGNNLAFLPTALSRVKSLKVLYIDSQNEDFELQRFIIIPYIFEKLTLLSHLRMSLIRLDSLSRYCLYGLRNLETVFLSLTNLKRIEDYAFESLTSLTVLDLRGNEISSLSNLTFFGLKNLTQLYLNSNEISFISYVYPFQHSPLINVMLLQNNFIRILPKGTFSNLENLKIMALGKNKLIPWQERMLHPNASLNILGLAENNIDYISDTMLSEFHQVTGHLDLNKNPFNCSMCGMKEFQTFVQNSNLSFRLPLPEMKDSVYICVNPESMQNESFFDIELPDFLCQDIESEILSLIDMVLISFFLIVTILVSSFCYMFRWYIRYWIFHFKTNFFVKRGYFREKNYTFDAFIIYSSADTEWVEGHLIPALEEQEPRYKLCVHQRDFKVGKQITENILEAIESSNKVILILTEAFIKSEWCLYELHLAQHKLFDDTRDILILVKLRAIDKKLYTKNVSYIEKTRKCYMWNDSHIGQKLFWQQIRKHLGPPRSGQDHQYIYL